jgi:hypothetical protein
MGRRTVRREDSEIVEIRTSPPGEARTRRQA